MERINTSNKAVDLFGAGKDGFQDGNPGLGVFATFLSAAWFNAMQEEIANVIEGAGIALIPGDNTQLEAAINALITAQLMPSGTMIDFGGTVAPAGFLLCDGSNVSRATYAALFAGIGTTWGAGDGVTTFTLPDMRRRVAVGSGGSNPSGMGVAVGQTGGEEVVTLTLDQIPTHTHSIQSIDATGGTSGKLYRQTAGNENAALGTNAAGGGNFHNNMQPSAIVLKVIKI